MTHNAPKQWKTGLKGSQSPLRLFFYGFKLSFAPKVLRHNYWTRMADTVQHRQPHVGDHKPPEAVGRQFGPQNLTLVYAAG